MADRLNGYRVLILETREEAQFSRLLSEQGADVLQCPMFAINDALDPAPIEAWIRRAIEKPFDDLVLLTGEGLRRLMKVVRRVGAEQDFVAAIGKSRKFPGLALRGRLCRWGACPLLKKQSRHPEWALQCPLMTHSGHVKRFADRGEK